MEILKQSVVRDTGAKVLVNDMSPGINWNTKSKSLALKTKLVREDQSTYEYVVHLSVNDIQEIVGTLTKELLKVPKEQ